MEISCNIVKTCTSHRYRTAEPARVHSVDEAEVRLRAQGEEALLEAHVRQLYRAVLLPHLLRHLPQGGGA